MIRGMHAMFYSSAAEEFRNFVREKLGFTFTDVGDGWLIFDLPEADLGCHPADAEQGSPSGTPHVSFYCDDIEQTVAAMQSRGVEFTGPVEDHGYGLVTFFRMPGEFSVQLYQPKYVKNARPRLAEAPAVEKRKSAGRKAAKTRKQRAAGKKAAATKKRRATSAKAVTTKKAKKVKRRGR
jgi:catechol 2,3-dioxygenase-like lactoylglutathione lyase family enzyme